MQFDDGPDPSPRRPATQRGYRPRVSVGIPVFNGEQYLERAIRSVMAQSHKDLELVLVDNASTDRTSELCRVAQSDPRIKYFRQIRNVGAVANFNRALELAVGEFFCWLAHDDWIAPEFLERCIRELDGSPSAVGCSTIMGVVDETGGVFRVQQELLSGLRSGSTLTRFHRIIWSLQDPTAPVFGVMRTQVLRELGGIPAVPEPDRHLLYALSLRGELVAVPELLFFHFGPPGHMKHYGSGRLHRRSWDWLHAPGTRKPKVSAMRVLMHQLRLVGESRLNTAERIFAVFDVIVCLLVRRSRSKGRKLLGGFRRRREPVSGS